MSNYAEVLCKVEKNLSEEEKNSVVWQILKNPCISEEILVKLAQDSREWVRICVAANPKTPAAALGEISSKDASFSVRETLSRRI